MKTDVWMPLYIGDYMADTIGFSHAQHGLYLLVIMAYWRNGGPLPEAAAKDILRGASDDDGKRIALLFSKRGEMWCHNRIDQELLKAKKTIEARSKAGKRGASSRWADGKGNGKRITKAQQNDAPSPSHLTEREAEREVELPAGFPTEANARQIAHFVGCPEQFAVDTWNKASGRGGRDAKDVPIRSFRHYLANEWKFEQNRVGEKKHNEQHKHNQPSSRPRTDLNQGTANDGAASEYAQVGKRQRIPDAE